MRLYFSQNSHRFSTMLFITPLREIAMFKPTLSLTFLSLFLFGCASDVATDYDASVDFSGFKTYQYKQDPDVPVTLDEARIKTAVDQEMMVRGMSLMERNAQITVHYEIIEASELLADGPTFSFGFGSGSVNSVYGAGVSTPTRVKEKKFGKLSVSLIDAQSNDVFWRSISQRQLTETMDSEERSEFVQDQVHQMFAEYPILPVLKE